MRETSPEVQTAIRAKYRNGITIRALSSLYGISPSGIAAIIQRDGRKQEEIYLILTPDPLQVFAVESNFYRAAKRAENIAGLVVTLPVNRDYRKKETS